MKKLVVRTLYGARGWVSLGIAVGATIICIQQPASARDSLIYPTANRQPQLIAVSLLRRNLRPGDRGEDVILLQNYLRQNGLYAYSADGVYGQDTADAVRTYQRILDLPATGVADEETLISMEFDFLPDSSRPTTTVPAADRRAIALQSGELSLYDTGTDIIALQQRLNSFGIPLSVDGDYGFETQQAVRTYQRVQGLDVTGRADSETLSSMGFNAPSYRYVAAVIEPETRLNEVLIHFPNAFIDRNRQGRFINVGSFAERLPAEARVDAAAARGFTTRVLYR